MNEQNRERLSRMAKRHAARRAQKAGDAESAATFLAQFLRARDDVLRPVMEDIGTQLRAQGYDFTITDGGARTAPRIDFHIVLQGRGDAKDTIRFFAHEDDARGWQVIAELELERSPSELARFDAGDPVTRDVAEQLIVDATEQMFASSLSASRVAAPAPARVAARPAPGNAEAVSPEPSEVAQGVRGVALTRLREGRVLHGLDLVGADLHGLDFSGRLLLALDLRRANLQGATFVGARLVAARLEGADLTGADLTGADLSRANLTGAVLDRAGLDGVVSAGTIGLATPRPHAPPAPEPTGASTPPAPAAPALDAPSPPLAEILHPAPRAVRVARARGPVPVFETAPVDDLPPSPALPFAPPRAAASVAMLRKTEVLPVFTDPKGRGADTTQDGPIVRSEPALPFGAHAAPLRLADLARDVSRKPEHFVWAAETEPPSERDPANEAVIARIPLPDLRASALFAPAPAAPPAPSPDVPPVLTLEQYASLCATLVTFPATKAATMARYGITTDDDAAALRERWRAQFDGDPPTLARWRALFGEYCTWLSTNAGRAELPVPRRDP
jgi:hypothetical protein